MMNGSVSARSRRLLISSWSVVRQSCGPGIFRTSAFFRLRATRLLFSAGYAKSIFQLHRRAVIVAGTPEPNELASEAGEGKMLTASKTVAKVAPDKPGGSW